MGGSFNPKDRYPSITHVTTATDVTQICDICGVRGHIGGAFQLLAELVHDRMNYAQQGNPYSHTYNPAGTRNHPKFSYKNNNMFAASPAPPVVPPGFQGQSGAYDASQKLNLKMMMENFILT